jgi:hypothetical protein
MGVLQGHAVKGALQQLRFRLFLVWRGLGMLGEEREKRAVVAVVVVVVKTSRTAEREQSPAAAMERRGMHAFPRKPKQASVVLTYCLTCGGGWWLE